jgi:hypothetical protein
MGNEKEDIDNCRFWDFLAYPATKFSDMDSSEETDLDL